MVDEPAVERLVAAAVLFDMDGVLLDSTAGVEALWVAFAHEHALDADEVVGDLHGRRMADVIRNHLPELTAAQLEGEIARFEQAEVADAADVEVLPGAIALTRGLAGVPWAIVTSSNRVVAEARLAHSGLPTPPVLVTADDVRRGKPAPDPYRQAAAALGVAPGRTVVFEDAPAGLAAGRAAGGTVVALATSHPVGAFSDADHVVDNLTAVTLEVEDGRLWLSLVETRRPHGQGA